MLRFEKYVYPINTMSGIAKKDLFERYQIPE